MDESLPALRHAARGCLNAIKLCVAAVELPGPPEEQIEFLDDVIQSSQKMCALLDQLDEFEPSHSASAPADI